MPRRTVRILNQKDEQIANETLDSSSHWAYVPEEEPSVDSAKLESRRNRTEGSSQLYQTSRYSAVNLNSKRKDLDVYGGSDSEVTR
jgi:hypothetical protein